MCLVLGIPVKHSAVVRSTRSLATSSLRQEAARDEQLNRLLGGYFDRGKQTLECNYQVVPLLTDTRGPLNTLPLKTRYLFSHEQFQKTLCDSFDCAKETQHLQLKPWISSEKEDAFEQQIAGRWHIITLQEASDYVDHELLTNRFHMTHHAGCAKLENKDTFYTNIDVKSIYLHDTRRDLPA